MICKFMETLTTLGENLSIESVTPRFVVIHHVLTTRYNQAFVIKLKYNS